VRLTVPRGYNSTTERTSFVDCQLIARHIRWPGESVALLVARRTNNRKVVGSRLTKCVSQCWLWWTIPCGRPPLLLPSCRKLEFRLSALMESDLAWVNGKSGRQSWCYADAFQRSNNIGSHLPFYHLADHDGQNGDVDVLVRRRSAGRARSDIVVLGRIYV